MQARTRASRERKRQADQREISDLQQACETLELGPEDRAFSLLPLSPRTRQGLKRAGFLDMTPIQKEAVPIALRGRDVAGFIIETIPATYGFPMPAEVTGSHFLPVRPGDQLLSLRMCVRAP